MLAALPGTRRSPKGLPPPEPNRPEFGLKKEEGHAHANRLRQDFESPGSLST